MNSGNMSNHSSTKNFGKSLSKLRPADVMTFFLAFTGFWVENWTSADVITFFFFFFGLHSNLGGKLDICECDDLFFGLHLIVGERGDP